MTGIAVIGTGYWGKNHARVCKELLTDGLIDKVRICDSNEASLRELSKTLGIEGTADYHQILSDPAIQAIIIATPSKTHYQIAKASMEAGKDVLVEKPMTMNVKEAEDLVSIAYKNGRILMAGHIFRYHPAVRELKRRIDAGELGEIQNIISSRETFSLPRRDMGVIYALGIHELDMFCYLLEVDYPKSLIAMTSSVYNPDIEETASIFVDFGKVKGYAFESWMMPTASKRRELIVAGSKMSTRVDYLKPQELYLFDVKIIVENSIPVAIESKGERTIALPYAEPLKEELKHLLSCVSTKQKPLSDGLVGLRAVVMAEAALKSTEAGKAVALPS